MPEGKLRDEKGAKRALGGKKEGRISNIILTLKRGGKGLGRRREKVPLTY